MADTTPNDPSNALTGALTGGSTRTSKPGSSMTGSGMSTGIPGSPLGGITAGGTASSSAVGSTARAIGGTIRAVEGASRHLDTDPNEAGEDLGAAAVDAALNITAKGVDTAIEIAAKAPEPTTAAVGKALKVANKATGGKLSKIIGGALLVNILGAFFVLLAIMMTVVMLVTMLVGVISFGGVGTEYAQEQQCAPAGTDTAGQSIPSPFATQDIPPVALKAYEQAGQASGVDWTYIAAIGKVESGHGTFGGDHLNNKGETVPNRILGPVLNGSNGTTPVPDTDNGTLDGDTRWDRAVGPMQFIPSTWKTDGKDGNNDGITDPSNIFDAAYTTGFYLKSGGAPDNMNAAILSYNHSASYVTEVESWATKYDGGVPDTTTTTSSDGNENLGPTGNEDTNVATTKPVTTTLTLTQTNTTTDTGTDTTGTGTAGENLGTLLTTALTHHPDFVSLNGQTNNTNQNITAHTPGYSLFRINSMPGDDTQAKDTAILYKTNTWTKLDGGRIQTVANDKVTINGTTHTQNDYITWATFNGPNNSITSFISMHATPNPDTYGPNPKTRQATDQEATQYVTTLADTLATHGPVFIAGDLNVLPTETQPWSPVTVLNNDGFTNQNNTTNYVWYQDSPQINVTKTWADTNQPTLTVQLQLTKAVANMTGVDAAPTGCVGGDGNLGITGIGNFNLNNNTIGGYTTTQLISRAQAYAAHTTGWTDHGLNGATYSTARDYIKGHCQSFTAQVSGYSNSLAPPPDASAWDKWNQYLSNGKAHPASSPDGMTPPVGAQLYFKTSSIYGHVVIYLGSNVIVSTDTATDGTYDAGRISIVSFGTSWVNNEAYLGWAPPTF